MAMTGFDQNQHSVMVLAFGENPGTSCRVWAGLSYWFKGRLDRADEMLHEGIELTRHPGQEYAQANAYTHAATMHQLKRDPVGALRWSTLAEETGLK